MRGLLGGDVAEETEGVGLGERFLTHNPVRASHNHQFHKRAYNQKFWNIQRLNKADGHSALVGRDVDTLFLAAVNRNKRTMDAPCPEGLPIGRHRFLIVRVKVGMD